MSLKGKIDWAFVSLPLLLSLFKFCPECGSNCQVIKVSKTGFALMVTYRCNGVDESHQKTWVSSPSTRWNYDINLMFPAMASMSGLGYTLLENVMNGLRIPYCSSTTFYKNIKIHLYPAIVHRWELMRTALLELFKSKEVDIDGDGHYDSPGWTAKFCTYSILEISSGAILDLFVCQKGMYDGDLEMESCREVLKNLVAKGLREKNFVTDENNKVSKMLRECFPRIFHALDIWHKARLIKKKLMKMKIKHPDLEKFIPSIVNHFWYSCQHCKEDPELLLEIFHSCLLHICNKHAWTEDPLKSMKEEIEKSKRKNRKSNTTNKTKKKSYPFFRSFRKCRHASRIKHRRLRGLKWLDIKSDLYKDLFKYLTDTRLCNSLKKCCRFIHTGGLEVYHNVRLKLLPKRSSYSLIRMIVMGMLTAIDVNSNLEGVTRKEYWTWSRSQKKYVIKNRILNKNYRYRIAILEDMMEKARSPQAYPPIEELLVLHEYIKGPIPKKIVSVEFPSEDPTSVEKSRF